MEHPKWDPMVVVYIFNFLVIMQYMDAWVVEKDQILELNYWHVGVFYHW